MSSYTMPEGYVRPSAERAAQIGFAKAVPPEPKRYAQCRNCKHFNYDDSEYMGASGRELSRQVNFRCRLHKIIVLKSCVCAAHEFAYPDRGDR